MRNDHSSEATIRPEYCITLLRILLRFGVNWVGKRCLRSWRGFSPMMQLLPRPLAFGNRWNQPAIGAGHYHDERIPYWQEPTGNWQLSHMTSPVPCGVKVRHGALPDTSMSHQSIVLGGHTEWLYFSAFSKYVAAQYIMSSDKRPAIASIKSGSADRRARNLRPATASALREISANTRPPDPPSSTPDSLDFYSPFERRTSSDSGDDW